MRSLRADEKARQLAAAHNALFPLCCEQRWMPPKSRFIAAVASRHDANDPFQEAWPAFAQRRASLGRMVGQFARPDDGGNNDHELPILEDKFISVAPSPNCPDRGEFRLLRERVTGGG